MLLRLHYRWPDRRRAGGAYPLLGGADFRAGVADLLLSAHGAYGMGGWLPASLGALDFAGGTVVHISAASAGLAGAYLLGKRAGFGKEAFKPHNIPMVFTGTAILYVGWFGFNAGSASAANEIVGLAFINTVMATAGAILS